MSRAWNRMEVDTHNTPPLLHRVVPEALPQRLRTLLDATQPLAQPHRHLRRRESGWSQTARWIWIAVLAVIAGLLGRSLWIGQWDWSSASAWMQGTIVATAHVVLGVLAWRTWKRIQRARRMRNEPYASAWRHGLFFEQDGLLIHAEGAVSWIPRDQLAWKKTFTGAGAGSNEFYSVVWRAPNGKRCRESLGPRAEPFYTWFRTGDIVLESMHQDQIA